MKPIKLVYSAFQDLDIFLVHDNGFFGRIIRFAERENIDTSDDVTPTHGGFIYEDHGQMLSLQMNPRLVSETLEQYTGRKIQMVSVWRYMLWDESGKKDAVDYLSYIRRKNAECTRYDLWGAITSSPVGKKVFGWLPFAKNKKDRWFCTEMVGDILKKYADSMCILSQNPFDLQQYFQRRGESVYKRVIGWKVDK